MCFQIVKVWSEDGAGKVVEIPANMTARDVCQLLVYKSHCLDDSAWSLVEHHPILGIGKNQSVLCGSQCGQRCSILTFFFLLSFLQEKGLKLLWCSFSVLYYVYAVMKR